MSREEIVYALSSYILKQSYLRDTVAEMRIPALPALLVLMTCLVVLIKAQLECTAYISSAEGLFKKPFFMMTRYQNSVITNVTLIERHSYYTCEPHEKKFGVEEKGERWWVFRGCGGVFEVEECSKTPSIPLRLKNASEIPNDQRTMEMKTMQEFGVGLPTDPPPAQTGDFRGTLNAF